MTVKNCPLPSIITHFWGFVNCEKKKLYITMQFSFDKRSKIVRPHLTNYSQCDTLPYEHKNMETKWNTFIKQAIS